MKNLDVVLKAVKDQCGQANVPNKKCMVALENFRKDNNIEHPIYFYLDILMALGLIEYSWKTDEVTLTEKGRDTNSELYIGC